MSKHASISCINRAIDCIGSLQHLTHIACFMNNHEPRTLSEYRVSTLKLLYEVSSEFGRIDMFLYDFYLL